MWTFSFSTSSLITLHVFRYKVLNKIISADRHPHTNETFRKERGDPKFIMKRYSERCREYLYMSVGVMRDSKLDLRDLHVSDTPGSTGDWNT